MNNFKKTVKEIVMTSVICATFAAAAQLAGSGSAEDPFLIASVGDLLEFADSVNAGEATYNDYGVNVALAADLDMAGVEFPGIGTEDRGFFGTFDGCGHTIANIMIEDMEEEAWAIGFFKFLGNCENYAVGTVKNVNIQNISLNGGECSEVIGFVSECYSGVIEKVSVSGRVDIAGWYEVGTLVGWADNVTIRDCVVSGDTGSSVSGDCDVGALVGGADSECIIDGCRVIGVDVNGNAFSGGLVGFSWCDQEITDSEFVEPMPLLFGAFGGFSAGNANEETQEEDVLPTHEGVEAINPTAIPFEGPAPETDYDAEYFTEVRAFADYLAKNGLNCKGFADENLDLFRFAMWVDNFSGAESVEELCSAPYLFAAYAFNLPYDTFANAKPSMVTEILNGVPEDGWTTIVLHVKAGDTELEIDSINANVFLKYGQSLDAMDEYLLSDDCVQVVKDDDGFVRAQLVIGPPEGSSQFFKVSVR